MKIIMLKLSHILMFIVIYLIKIVHNQLIIKPAASIISHDQFKPFIALCTGQRNTRVVAWRSPSQIDIEENNQERITVEHKPSGLRLRIRNLTENDQGTWICLGVDPDGRSVSNTIQLIVKTPITFISEFIQYAELDSTVLIKCQVISNPSAEISWLKGENKINLLSSNYQQTADGLKINRVSSIDNDSFWCQADVIETGESKDYRIQVLIAQSITSTKITCLTPCAVEKRTATLICEANGIPSPQYSWSYGQNGPFIVNGTSKFAIRGNRLIINYVDETDNGRYVCQAFNDYDKKGKKTEYLLNVIIPPYLSTIPQIEISIDENVPSQQVTFPCRLERGSMQTLSLEWLYANNTPIQPINGISIVVSPGLIELIFNPVRREHHGNYTCLAKNSGDSTSTIAHLIVQYKPVFLEPGINEVYSVPDHHIIMKCQFDSYPPPVIQWIQLLQRHDHHQMILEADDPQVINIVTKKIGPTIYETQLTFDPLEEDFGLNFECRADNSRIEKHLITLRRAKSPQQARILETKPTSNTIVLNVQAPVEFGGLPLLQYIVTYAQIGVPDSLKNSSFPVLSNISQLMEIGPLQVASLYRIQVAVESHAGQSIFSTPVQAITLSGKVPQFSLSNDSCLNCLSCLIKWFIQDNGGSPISQITISYTKIDRNGKEEKWSKPIRIGAQTTEYELKGLKPNTNYSILVRLNNTAGYAEQKTRKTTNKCPPKPPSIWIIIAIIISIIMITIVGLVVLILPRVFCQRLLCRSVHPPTPEEVALKNSSEHTVNQ